MSIFGKPVSQIQPADLDELLREGAVESTRLEFKSEVPNKEDTLKNLSSFANTFGGYVVVGARADSKDGRLKGLPGVESQNSYKQQIVTWSSDRVSPPLTVEVSDPILVNGQTDRFCYVIAVRESDTAPHFIEGGNGVWVRTDEYSKRVEVKLANESQLRHLFDRRKLVLERKTRLLDRAKKRFDRHLSTKHTDLSGARTKTKPLLQINVIPRFPSQQLYPQMALQDFLKKLYTSWRQVIFPNFSQRPFRWQDESIIVPDAAYGVSYFEATVWGSMFYAVEIETEHPEDQVNGIHPYQVVGYILLFVDHAAKVLKAGGYSGSISIQFALTSIVEIPWLQFHSGTAVGLGSKSEFDDDVIFGLTTSSDQISDNRDGVVLEILERLFYAINWPNAVGTQADRNALLQMGYRYNFWR